MRGFCGLRLLFVCRSLVGGGKTFHVAAYETIRLPLCPIQKPMLERTGHSHHSMTFIAFRSMAR